MRHDQHLRGYAFQLRPIRDQDAEFVVALRTDANRSRFLHATSPSVQDQRDWLARYYEREDDYYFVLERQKTLEPEGLVALYNFDESRRSAEFGRCILKHDSLAAVECVWLNYRVAFEQLGLTSVFSRTIAENAQVVSFHDCLGIAARRVIPAAVELSGKLHDFVEHTVDMDCWGSIAPRLEKLARRTAERFYV